MSGGSTIDENATDDVSCRTDGRSPPHEFPPNACASCGRAGHYDPCWVYASCDAAPMARICPECRQRLSNVQTLADWFRPITADWLEPR